MRGIALSILAIGLLVFGCVELPPPGTNMTNGTQQYPDSGCSGPVCGADGVTYGTDCDAAEAGTAVAYQGECAEQAPCEDSDGGINAGVFGTATKGNESKADYCYDFGLLVENFCRDGNIQYMGIKCVSGKVCRDGMCVLDEAANLTNETAPANETPPETETAPQDEPETANYTGAKCVGPATTDPYKKETTAFNGLDYADVCVDYKIVKEYYCRNDSLESVNNECPGGDSCNMGVCTPVLSVCDDSDGGNDTIVKGSITVSKGIYTTFTGSDECIDEGRILEQICLDDGSYISQELLCGSGRKCVGARCVRSECSETDDGIDLFHAGEATYDEESYRDDCYDENRVKEYFCYGDGVDSVTEYCPDDYHCSGDRCVED